MNKISEVDLLIYYLSIDKKFYELLELYGILIEQRKCPKCGHDSNMHFKVIREIIERFGSVSAAIKVPSAEDLTQVSRDITIWRGLLNCTAENSLSLRVEEYSSRYQLTPDNIYKIRNKVAGIVEKFQHMKKVFRKYRKV